MSKRNYKVPLISGYMSYTQLISSLEIQIQIFLHFALYNPNRCLPFIKISKKIKSSIILNRFKIPAWNRLRGYIPLVEFSSAHWHGNFHAE